MMRMLRAESDFRLNPSSTIYCIIKGKLFPGVSRLLASLGHTGRKGIVLGHTLKTLRYVITKKIS